MAETTSIEWTDATFNPWVGCTKISPACDHCYAEGWAKRAGNPELWQGQRRRTSAANWRVPHKLNAQAVAEGRRIRVFCASLADVFDNQVPEDWRADLWALIRATPALDWQLLTKRPQNIAGMLPADWAKDGPCGWPNVWLGTTVENQTEADRRIPHLLAVPAKVRFLSCEPLLGPVDLTWIAEPDEEKDGVIDALLGCNWIECPGEDYRPVRPGHEGRRMSRWVVSPEADILANSKLDWVIAGGESGPGSRPSHPEWFRALRDQCAASNKVPFLFKQWGDWVSVSEAEGGGQHHRFPDGATVRRSGKAFAGRTLDGRVHDGFPA